MSFLPENNLGVDVDLVDGVESSTGEDDYEDDDHDDGEQSACEALVFWFITEPESNFVGE